MNKNNLGPMIKSSIHSLSLIFILFVIVNLGMPVFAYDQPWNGFREDITSPDPDPDPPCPSGNCKCPPNGTRSPVYVADGSLVWSETDIQFPTNAQITLTRTYNSFDERSGLFGRGWVTAQESNIARTYRALDEGNADGSPSTATNFGSVPIWLASYGRRYVLQETATHCTPPSVLYFTFEKLADGKFKQVFDDNQSYSIFNENGVLLQTYSDSDGSSIYYVYDQQNRLTQQFDSFGFTLNFIYNDQGFVSEVNDQLGRTWSYSYDEFGRLVEVLDPDGNTRSYTYNLVDNIGYKQHFLTSINDNTDDLVLKVNWAQLAIGLNSQMRVSNYMESDGHRHDYTYTATTYAGVPAIRVNKNTKQVNSSATIEAQTFYADASNYQVLYETNSTDSTSKTSKFDSRGNIIEEIDERGNVTQFQYNTQGRITTEIELAGTPQARTISITYWNNTDRVASYNEYGLKETRYTYDANLRVLTETEVDLVSNDQRITAYTYHANSTDAQGNLILGKVATIDGPLPGAGDIQTYAYNQQGLLTQLSNPLNQNVSYNYNAIGQLSSETDVNGVVTNYTYDSRNRVIQTERNNRIFKITYDTQGLIKQMIDELGRTTLIAYDTFNQVNRLDLASGDYKTYSYTYGSNYTEITERYYQANNTLVSSRVSRQDPISKLPLQVFLANVSQQVQNSTYNAYDDVVQKTLYGQFDSGTTSTTTYSYDNEGRLSRVVDHLSNVTDLAYDDFHRTTQVTDANNATTQYAYNAWGDLLQLNSQDTGLTNFQVDSAGNIISQTNANNQTTNFTFDPLNRLTTIDYQGTEFDSQFTYDEGVNGKGLLTSVIDGSGSTQFQFNDRGLVTATNTTIQGLSFNLAYAFNDADEITETTYPSGIKVLTNYDTAGRLASIQLNDTVTTRDIMSTVVWSGPNLASYSNGNGILTEHIYDNAGRLVEKRFGANNRLQNNIDNQNQITRQTWIRDGVQDINNYQHDATGRLTRDGSPSDGLDLIFNYDGVGNRLSQARSDSSVVANYSYQANSNIMNLLNGAAIQYDAIGNVLNDGNRQYQYNAMNRLQQLTNALDNIQATYSYNYQGQRVRKQLTGNLVDDIRYVYGFNGELIGEYDLSGNPIREYIYHRETSLNVTGSDASEEDAQDNVVSTLLAIVDASGSIFYVHTDHLETPRLVSNQTQAVVWRWDSDGFGVGAANEDPDGDSILFTLHHRFPGQYFDLESGLHYNFFRYYDPITGRFITSDPIGLGGGLNTYTYSSSNPLNDFDQHGLVCGTGLCVAIVVTVGRVAIVGWKAYKNYKKWKKAQIRLCRRVYSAYKKACGGTCKGLTSCGAAKYAYARAQTCATGRNTYVSLGCDAVIKTTKNHPGAAAAATRNLQKCQKVKDKLCGCEKK